MFPVKIAKIHFHILGLQVSPLEDQSVPFEYQLGLCQRLCEMVKRIFQTNVHGI